MFLSQESLKKKSGSKGVDRPQYLKELVEEFNSSQVTESRLQVLANLSNFAYDPINYQYLHELKVVDLFLEQLEEEDICFKEFAVTGLCNFSLDERAQLIIQRKGGIPFIVALLSSKSECCIIQALTTLYYLATSKNNLNFSFNEIDVIDSLAAHENPRIKNLASVYIKEIGSQKSSEDK